jgi:hypothetical protein
LQNHTVTLRDRWRPLAAWAFAIALVGVSFFSYASRFGPAERWQASNFDPADYQLGAEHFWHVRIPASRFDVDADWVAFLNTVPFRGIGLGTLYLIVGLLRTGHVPSTPTDILAAGVALATLEKILTAAALFTLFEVVRRTWGTLESLVAISATALPPRFWRLTDDLLAEPILHICFLLLLACAIGITRRKSMRLAFAMIGLMFIAAQMKADWELGALLLAALFLFSPPISLTTWREKFALCLAAALIPLSVTAVNWIGWRTLSPRPGMALHVNLKYGGALLQRFCSPSRRGSHRSPFCDEERRRHLWWKIYLGRDVTVDAMTTFDNYARRDIIAHPARGLRELWTGVQLASSVPGTAVRMGAGFRLVPLEEPWRTMVRWVDLAVWICLLVGCSFPSTRLPCGVALILWIIPAVGNVFSLYELRYHMPMAGIAATCAFRVLALRVRRADAARTPQAA